jgi:hypothetical protein
MPYLYREEILALPPPSLGTIFGFLKRHPDYMFVFADGKACLTYERGTGVVYLIGNFDNERGMKYNTHVAQYAKEAQMN